MTVIGEKIRPSLGTILLKRRLRGVKKLKKDFKIIGTLPKVGRLKGLGYVDAHMMYFDLTQDEQDNSAS